MSILNRFKKTKKEQSPNPQKDLSSKQAPKDKIKIKEEKWFEPEGELAIDVYQTENEIIIEAPVAGVKVEDLDIALDNDVVKIKGKRERCAGAESRNYLIQECYWGAFSKEIILPVEIDNSKVEATIEQGILTIKIKKAKEKKKKKIKIKEK